jgi:phage protein D
MSLGITITVNGKTDPALALADKVEVYERMGETTMYSVFYPEDINNGDMIWSADSRIDQGSVLAILAGANNSSQCLAKGPVYGHQLHFVHGGKSSTIEVKGADTGITMDREFKSAVWNDVSDSDVVATILNNYGLSPDVYVTSSQHLEAKHSLVQQQTDLGFIRMLARRNGCIFNITSDASGNETAHFQRPQLDGASLLDLSINVTQPTIENFNVTWNVENPTSITASQLDLNTKNTISGNLPVTPQTILAAKKLSDITGDTRSIQVAAPADDAGEMHARSEGALIEADWFIRATCTTSLSVLGSVVRSGTLVNIAGAGSRHSGKYLVYAVKHIIDGADHMMEIELVRNGWNAASAMGAGLVPSF